MYRVWSEAVWRWAEDGEARTSGQEDGHTGAAVWGTTGEEFSQPPQNSACILYHSIYHSPGPFPRFNTEKLKLSLNKDDYHA